MPPEGLHSSPIRCYIVASAGRGASTPDGQRPSLPPLGVAGVLRLDGFMRHCDGSTTQAAVRPIREGNAGKSALLPRSTIKYVAAIARARDAYLTRGLSFTSSREFFSRAPSRR